ncbi:PH domain-containing protein [Microbacterium sp. TNHR37B]|uniref:PH domain-containing protein n=1 Tax=Microbacterium sp. TNHR37B TaxID=1775956 RepID=UPI00082BCB52|nr:PH domain-containing protein [Microbacterium sp. TNHR37B]
MSQPSSLPGRPLTPASGAAAPEMRVARVRSHARRLLWSALVLIAVATAMGYYSGNLPSSWTAWLPDDLQEAAATWLLWSAAAVVVIVLVVIPYLRWLAHTYTITTRRVIERSGLVARRRVEITHARGYTISEKRGPLQRLWGTGDLVLSNGVEQPVRLTNVPAVRLVHETLADQVEISQILAHRDAHGPGATGATTVLP